MNDQNKNNFFQNLPDIPWPLIIFLFFTPLSFVGIAFLVMKLLKESHPAPRDPRQYQARAAAQQQRQDLRTGSAKGFNYQRRFPYKRIKDGKGWTIAGAIIAGIFGFALSMTIAEWGLSDLWYIMDDLIPLSIFTFSGIGMLLLGNFRNRKARKFKRYLARISNEPIIPLRPLAESLAVSMDEVYETLQQMIDEGLFGDRAYIDIAGECLVVDAAVARPAPVPKPKEPVKEKKIDLSSEDKILYEIRRANERIPGEEISRKIDRIEEITRAILEYLKKHPERSSELHTFLDYYLPTTLKMLNTYAELDEQGMTGQNIETTKRRIEGILDKVVEGFELQLDKLYEGDMLDISSDIDVMEKMLQRDGLSGATNLRSRSVQAQASQGYTPSLTLDPAQNGASAAATPAPQAAEQELKGYDTLGNW